MDAEEFCHANTMLVEYGNVSQFVEVNLRKQMAIIQNFQGNETQRKEGKLEIVK
jgi:hypothetical protein